MMQSTARRLAAPLLMVALGLTACSGGGGKSSGDGSGTSSGSAAPPGAGAAQAAYMACLEKNGVKLTADGKDIDKDANNAGTETAAFKACQSVAPADSPDPATVAAAKKLTDCMHKAGITDYPEPDASGNINPGPELGAKLKGDPKTIVALKKCSPAGASGGTSVVGG